MERGLGYDNLDASHDTSAARFWAGYRSWPQLLIRLGIAAVLLVVLDLIWFQLAGLLGVNYFNAVKDIQGGQSLAWRPIGFLAYLSMSYALASMTNGPAEGARLGYVIYSIFDFTSTFMFHEWTLYVALLDTLWGTLLFTAIAALLQQLSRVPQYQRFE